MTPDQLQPVIDSLTAEANRCVLDGERRAASALRGAARSLEAYLPVKASSAPVEAAPAPELEPERVGVPEGVFGRFMSKSSG